MTPIQKTISPQAWAGLLMLSLIWGASFLSVHVALEEIGPITAVAHRTGWAMLILWAYVLIRRLALPTDLRVWGAFLVMGFLNNAIPFRCLIPWFDGAILSQEWKEALWDKFVTGAPRPRTPSELQYSDRKLRSRS